MDIVSGLTAAKLALNLAKDLREIDKSVDEASFKMKLAELMSALADTQVSFAEARTRIAELERELAELRDGARCPVCRKGHLEIIKTEPAMYNSTIEFHYCECTNGSCEYKTERMYDSSLASYTSQKKN